LLRVNSILNLFAFKRGFPRGFPEDFSIELVQPLFFFLRETNYRFTAARISGKRNDAGI